MRGKPTDKRREGTQNPGEKSAGILAGPYRETSVRLSQAALCRCPAGSYAIATSPCSAKIAVLQFTAKSRKRAISNDVGLIYVNRAIGADCFFPPQILITAKVQCTAVRHSADGFIRYGHFITGPWTEQCVLRIYSSKKSTNILETSPQNIPLASNIVTPLRVTNFLPSS